MSIKSYIAVARNRFAFDLRNSRLYWSISPITRSLYSAVQQSIQSIPQGAVLDVGAGGLNCKIFFNNQCSSYTSLDIENRTGEIDILADIQNMTPVPDNRYDTVFCSQVLEHIPTPDKAIKECYRVLKPGGHFLVTVPHISHYHEIPHDFYRYTHWGIIHLLEKSGFTIERHTLAGGLACFLAHPISIVLATTMWRIPVVKWLAYFLNRLLIVTPAFIFDMAVPTHRLYPQNIVVIAKKK